MDEVLQPCLNVPAYYPVAACSCCSIMVVKLNFLAQSKQQDITYAINSCACYLNNLHLVHYQAVKCIGHYLYGSCNRGLVFPTPNNINQLDAYIDSDFNGGGSWSKHTPSYYATPPSPVLVFCHELLLKMFNSYDEWLAYKKKQKCNLDLWLCIITVI